MSLDDCSQSVADSVTDNSQIRYAGLAEYTLTHAKLSVDLIACRVYYDGQPVHMNISHFRVLTCILLNKQRPVLRDEIEAAVYQFVRHTNLISVYVNKINKQLEGAGAPARFIFAKYGTENGYQLRGDA